MLYNKYMRLIEGVNEMSIETKLKLPKSYDSELTVADMIKYLEQFPKDTLIVSPDKIVTFNFHDYMEDPELDEENNPIELKADIWLDIKDF